VKGKVVFLLYLAQKKVSDQGFPSELFEKKASEEGDFAMLFCAAIGS
jgi:hypothetical protein